ncbi:MAG: TetR/AcrR family transcriptional regulator [Clostridiales bacterium]|nr:TetR/AcrR family transcriptional regulator [Clostridiales bacterium]
MHKTKRAIFDKSMQLFADKGYNDTSIEEITAVAGIAKGTFYYHFSSKEEVFNFLIDEGMKLLMNNIELKTNKAQNSIAKLKAVILIQIKIVIKYENFIRLILSEMWGKDKRSLKCKQCLLDYVDIIEKVVQDGIDKGEIKSKDAETIAYNIFGLISACLIKKQKNDGDIDIISTYEQFCKGMGL